MTDSELHEEFQVWAKSEGMDTATITFFSCGQHALHSARNDDCLSCLHCRSAGRTASRVH